MVCFRYVFSLFNGKSSFDEYLWKDIYESTLTDFFDNEGLFIVF